MRNGSFGSEFWFGITIGILGGALGNIWIELWYRVPDDPQKYLLPTIIATITFVVLMILLINKFRKALKEEKKKKR